MQKAYYIINKYSKFIEVRGEDSKNFLQGLITNDINNCIDNKIIYSCLLSPQGKFFADFFIFRKNKNYIVEIHEKYLENFTNKINIYKLRSNVEFIEIKNLTSIILENKEIKFSDDSFFLFQDPRNSKIGFKLFLSNDSINFNTLKIFRKLNYDFYKEILMKNLIPNSIDDLTINKSLLLENNYQNINAIDWNKGCYIGQEITARMKYRSLLKKKIYVLELLSGNINLGDNINVNDIIIGNIISKVGKYALCMLKINLVENRYLNKEIIQINLSTQLKFL